VTASQDERVAAKVEELDRLISALQGRRRELLEAAKPTKAAAATGPEAMQPRPTLSQEIPARTAPNASEAKKSEAALARQLDALPWKSFKKKEGEWAFLRDREGRLIDELQSATEFVDMVRKQGEVVVGKYRYHVSEDKFLNRYYAGGKTG
jgi:hypothetical protein